MNKKIIGGLALAVLLVFVGSSLTWSARTTTVTDWYQMNTRTIKITMKTDTLTVLGHHHYSDSAMKSPWVIVPVGIDFIVFVENQDSDSSLAYGPDTVNIALETAPYHGLAYDSATAVHKYQKGNILWKLPIPNFHDLQGGHQHFFWRGHGDSTAQASLAVAAAAIDTAAIDATSLKGNGINDMSGGGTVRANLGMLRFSLSVDAADSVLDALVRLNCYIIYAENDNPAYKTYGNIESGDLDYFLEAMRPDPPWNKVAVPENAIPIGTFRREVK